MQKISHHDIAGTITALSALISNKEEKLEQVFSHADFKELKKCVELIIKYYKQNSKIGS